MNKPSRGQYWTAAAAFAAAALHSSAARRTPFGAASDDALHLLLSRNLWSGVFAVPDATSRAATDPLPGYALLMTPVAWLPSAEFWLLRLPALAWSGALAYFVWSAARRVSGPAAAFAALALAALNPVLVGWAGVSMPDVPFSALAAAAFWELSREKPREGLLAGILAAAALLRPHGAILIPAVALGVWRARGPRAAARLVLLAAAPAALWLARNRLVSEGWSDYAAHARGFAAGGTALGAHAATVFARLGWGLLGWPMGRAATAAALIASSALVFGAVRLLRRRGTPAALGLALTAYLLGLVALHLGWRAWQSRYLLPFLPAAALLAAEALEPLLRRRPQAAALLLAALLAPGVRTALSYAADGAETPAAHLWPATAAWLKTAVPEGECVTSLEPYLLKLVAERRACLPQPAPSRAAWLAEMRARGARWILVRSTGPRTYTGGKSQDLLVTFDRWSLPMPPLKEAYRNEKEGTFVLRLD